MSFSESLMKNPERGFSRHSFPIIYTSAVAAMPELRTVYGRAAGEYLDGRVESCAIETMHRRKHPNL